MASLIVPASVLVAGKRERVRKRESSWRLILVSACVFLEDSWLVSFSFFLYLLFWTQDWHDIDAFTSLPLDLGSPAWLSDYRFPTDDLLIGHWLLDSDTWLFLSSVYILLSSYRNTILEVHFFARPWASERYRVVFGFVHAVADEFFSTNFDRCFILLLMIWVHCLHIFLVQVSIS